MRAARLSGQFKGFWPFYVANHYLKRSAQNLGVLLEKRRWRRRWDGSPLLSPEETERLVRREVLGRVQAAGGNNPRILFVSYGVSEYGRMNLFPTLRKFGPLSVFQPADYGWDYVSRSWLRQRREANEMLLRQVATAPSAPNLILGEMNGRLIEPETLSKLKETGAVIVNWSFDDVADFYGEEIGGVWSGPAALASAVDLNLTSTLESRWKYHVEGGLSLFFPEAANPDICRPRNAEFAYNVSFAGQRYGYRPLLIRFLRRHGINVVAFGRGWEAGALSSEEMVALYSRSRINLGFGGKNHMVSVQHLKGRDFEIPMSGGLYLTSLNPDLSACYEIGNEIACYDSPQDCLKKIRHLLAHPEVAESIREAGRARALRDHTWEQRLKKLFRVIGFSERA